MAIAARRFRAIGVTGVVSVVSSQASPDLVGHCRICFRYKYWRKCLCRVIAIITFLYAGLGETVTWDATKQVLKQASVSSRFSSSLFAGQNIGIPIAQITSLQSASQVAVSSPSSQDSFSSTSHCHTRAPGSCWYQRHQTHHCWAALVPASNGTSLGVVETPASRWVHCCLSHDGPHQQPYRLFLFQRHHQIRSCTRQTVKERNKNPVGSGAMPLLFGATAQVSGVQTRLLKHCQKEVTTKNKLRAA